MSKLNVDCNHRTSNVLTSQHIMTTEVCLKKDSWAW